MSVLNRYLLLRLTCPAVLRFPFTDRFLRSLPITQLKRLTYFFATKEAINPNWALAMAVLASLGALLAAPLVASIDRQHRETPLTVGSVITRISSLRYLENLLGRAR